MKKWIALLAVASLSTLATGCSTWNGMSRSDKGAVIGAGIARLPSYMLGCELADGRLRGLLRDYQTRSNPMYLVHPYQGGLPRRTQVLADFLVGWFQSNGEAIDLL